MLWTIRSKVAVLAEVSIAVLYNVCKFHVVYKIDSMDLFGLFNTVYADERKTPI